MPSRAGELPFDVQMQGASGRSHVWLRASSLGAGAGHLPSAPRQPAIRLLWRGRSSTGSPSPHRLADGRSAARRDLRRNWRGAGEGMRWVGARVRRFERLVLGTWSMSNGNADAGAFRRNSGNARAGMAPASDFRRTRLFVVLLVSDLGRAKRHGHWRASPKTLWRLRERPGLIHAGSRVR